MAEQQSLQEGLNKILASRRQLRGTVEERASQLQKEAGFCSKFTDTADKLLRKYSAEELKDLFGSEENRALFERSLQMARACNKALKDAAGEYSQLAVQFGRSRITLGVIGEIRTGKSTFLQKISNLNQKLLPAREGKSLTGATIIIENTDVKETEVCVAIKSKDKVLSDVNAELRAFGNHFGIKQQSEKDSLCIDALSKDALERSYQKLDGYRHKTSVSNGEIEEEFRNSWSIHVDYFQIWEPLLQRSSESVQAWKERIAKTDGLIDTSEQDETGNCWFRLADISKTAEYCSKHRPGNDLEHANELLPKHVAIDTMRIRTHFPGIDADNFCLIDTVGINDPAAETQNRMKSVLNEHTSDGIILLTRYGSQTHSPNYHQLDEWAKILTNRKKTNKYAGYSMALLVNAQVEPEKMPAVQNYFMLGSGVNVNDLSEDAKNTFSALKIYADGCRNHFQNSTRREIDLFNPITGIQCCEIANVMSEEHRERLIQFLNRFLKKIAEHSGDRERFDHAEKARESAQSQYDELLRTFSSLKQALPLNDEINSALIAHREVAEKLPKLVTALSRLSCNVEKAPPTPLAFFLSQLEQLKAQRNDKTEIGRICEEVQTRFYNDTFEQKIQHGRDLLYYQVRACVDREPDNYSRIEAEYKRQVAKEIIRHLGLTLPALETDRRKTLSAEAPDFFWELSDLLFPKGQQLPLRRFFEEFHRFHLNDTAGNARSIIRHFAARYLLCRDWDGRLDVDQFQPTVPRQETPQPEPNLSVSKTISNGSDSFVSCEIKAMGSVNPAPLLNKILPRNSEQSAHSMEKVLLRDLDTMVSDIRNRYFQGDQELYSISAQEQLQEAIWHIALSFEYLFHSDWQVVFQNLYHCGIILSEKKNKELRYTDDRLILVDTINDLLTQNAAKQPAKP